MGKTKDAAVAFVGLTEEERQDVCIFLPRRHFAEFPGSLVVTAQLSAQGLWLNPQSGNQDSVC